MTTINDNSIMRLLVLLSLFLLSACRENSSTQVESAGAPEEPIVTAPTTDPNRQAFFGDLHVHTSYSIDAFVLGTIASPDAAYRFAKGEVLRHPGGFDVQIDQPLDFYSVTDHAYFLGALRGMTVEGTDLYGHELAEDVRALTDEASRGRLFQKMGAYLRSGIIDQQVFKDAWDDIVAAANRHNDPGSFTAFIGYEYTSDGVELENLHRNVIFKGDAAPAFPFSRIDSPDPEDLWKWMDAQRAAGFESLAIPHNPNGSNGRMFSLTDSNGRPLDSAYADLRMRNEPVVENSQIKGTSDTHPLLSPNDEWADFEIMTVRTGSNLPSEPVGSYVREALMNGIRFQAEMGFNPFKFGVVGSSDTHTASHGGAEDDFTGTAGIFDDEPVERGSIPLPEPAQNGSKYRSTPFSTWSAGSLAGVWAEENTRESVYDALRRKETFSTSGTRLKLRFFAGYTLPSLDSANLIADAYRGGVPMGGELIAEADQEPSFLVWAAQDPRRSALDRLQVIKASVKDGKLGETVFDVACSDGGVVDSSSRCPDNGARVNLEDCSTTTDVGDPQLVVLWKDPEYDPTEHAMYYARVLENPVCRWSTWDAVRSGVDVRDDLKATIQERAWSSPIWISP